jgi:hypothetical protein
VATLAEWSLAWRDEFDVLGTGVESSSSGFVRTRDRFLLDGVDGLLSGIGL